MEDNNKDIKMPGVWVETSFEANFIMLDGEEAKDTSKNIACHKTSDRLGLPAPADEIPGDLSNVKDLEDIPSYILKMWIAIDKKLDALIHISSKDSNRLADAHSGTVVKLSQGGLILKTAMDIQTGKGLLVRLSPPVFPFFTVDIFGAVVSSDKAKGGTVVKLDFATIHQDDRELLITYVFKRQREILRSNMDEETEL